MADAVAPKHLLSRDFQRLQSIENHVSRSVEIAAEVVELLSQEGSGDALKARGLCSQFLENVKAAQEKIQEAVAETPTSRNFEATAGVYEAVYNADTAVLKVKTLSQCLSKMQALFSAAASSAPEPPAGAGEGSDSAAELEAAGGSPIAAGGSPTEATTAQAMDDEPMADAEAAGAEQQHPPPDAPNGAVPMDTA